VRRLGPFSYVYTPREQKIRDTIQHLVGKHGIVKARMLANEEYIKAANQDPTSAAAVWWNDVRWHIKQMIHSLNWGQEKGL
jgi:hypothetical protein